MKRAARRAGVVAALLGAGIWACSRPNDVAGIAGTYVMHITVTADTLVLRKDGRYVRSYRAPGEAAVIDSGGWFLLKNGRLVALRDYPKRWRWVHDCMYTGTVCKALTEPSVLALTVERPLGLGALRLGCHSNFGWWYSRIERM